MVYRHTSSITMTDSSLDGSCPRVGFFAQLVGASACSRRARSVHPPMSFLPKEAMKLYRVNVTGDDIWKGFDLAFFGSGYRAHAHIYPALITA